jgi:hypothetical protein
MYKCQKKISETETQRNAAVPCEKNYRAILRNLLENFENIALKGAQV